VSPVKTGKYSVNVTAVFDPNFVKPFSPLNVLEEFHWNSVRYRNHEQHMVNFVFDSFGQTIKEVSKIGLIEVNFAFPVHNAKLT
jgi:hypothetical protein